MSIFTKRLVVAVFTIITMVSLLPATLVAMEGVRVTDLDAEYDRRTLYGWEAFFFMFTTGFLFLSAIAFMVFLIIKMFYWVESSREVIMVMRNMQQSARALAKELGINYTAALRKLEDFEPKQQIDIRNMIKDGISPSEAITFVTTRSGGNNR